MAAEHRKSLEAVCVMFIVACIVRNSCGLIHEIHRDNIDKFLQGKLLTLTFVDSPSCIRCRILYPFFVAASQVFPHDPEIFFTRTQDASLKTKWGVTELPAIIYYRFGIKTHERFNVDITVDDIIDEIARILHGNFGGLTRTYSVYLNDKNYNELVRTPEQAVLMLIHDRDDAEEREVIEKLAYTFRKDDAIVFTSLDVVTQRKLRDDEFLDQQTPAMMWFSQDEKIKAKMFGGMITHGLLTQFVNERTGLHRNLNGDLKPQAGRIPSADDVLDSNIIAIMEGEPEDIKPVTSAIEAFQETVERQHAEMLEYYLYVLENIAAARPEKKVKSVLLDVQSRLNNKEGLSTKQQEAVNRKKNVVAHFLKLEDKYFKDRKLKTKEDIELEISERERQKKEKAAAKLAASEHISEHVEL